MKNLVFTALILLIFPACAQDEKPEVLPKEIQIKTALLAVPEDKQTGYIQTI